jgi:uncharacterized membrane protein HdeD (DUF308 family)
MDASLFLAKLVGLYLLILGVLGILRHREMKSLGKELATSKVSLAISGEISLLFGLVIAIDHSIWESSWRVLITIFGYLLILKGIMRIAYPARVQRLLAHMTEHSFGVCYYIMLIVGIYLTYCGFVQ